jgi:hypothetical protein
MPHYRRWTNDWNKLRQDLPPRRGGLNALQVQTNRSVIFADFAEYGYSSLDKEIAEYLRYFRFFAPRNWALALAALSRRHFTGEAPICS